MLTIAKGIFLQTLINKKNPAIGLGKLWQQNPALFDVKKDAFDHLTNFLRDVGT